jgi:hypothetical protein
MPGILIDFEAAKNKLMNPVSSVPKESAVQLSDAVATFAFSRLSEPERIMLILAGIFGGDAEQYASQAGELSYYASKGFKVPYAKRGEAS